VQFGQIVPRHHGEVVMFVMVTHVKQEEIHAPVITISLLKTQKLEMLRYEMNSKGMHTQRKIGSQQQILDCFPSEHIIQHNVPKDDQGHLHHLFSLQRQRSDKHRTNGIEKRHH